MQHQQQNIVQHFFEKMHLEASTTHQKARLSKMFDTVKKNFVRIDSIMKRKSETNMDDVLLVVSLALQHYILDVVNFYHAYSVVKDAKKLRTFVSAFSQTSLKKLETPFLKIHKNKARIAVMTEQQSDDYAESLCEPLQQYLIKKQRKLEAIAMKK